MTRDQRRGIWRPASPMSEDHRPRPEALRLLYRWAVQFVDPLRALNALVAFPRYFADWRSYSRLPGAEAIRFVDTFPQVHDWTEASTIDAHYFYVNGWAARRILANAPARHVDVGSQAILANMLGAVVPTIFMDYRPLRASLRGLTSVRGDILHLPLANDSIESLSCLHVVEHIGLGRYGEPLDPQGTKKAARELARVLAAAGNLYAALPVGRPRLCFNAHRVHAAETVRDYFFDLELVEFSGVHDDGRFVQRVRLSEFRDSRYACGMFWFRKAPA